ncbi:PEGA domain-containing protein [Nostoc favosum]|uniref:PEGA domain-containing protein n=1 Tax=Nostoc favosum CHAB5714 TaxID=2780399 RepID=A0ABS8IN67_9NOSO|nr:PEGA domain-containing protein [Nostoc favosum]MCC5604807.1 PEGA domain-containing protein [Nostoc favosum CHAB5714]
MRTYSLREPLGSRTLAAADFPLTLGGPGAVVLVPRVAPGAVAALVGLADGEPFLQPAGTVPVRLGDAALTESAWLHDGDRFDIEGARFRVDADGDEWGLTVEHEGGANETEPPLYEDLPLAIGAEDVPARQALHAIAFDAPAASAAAAVRRGPRVRVSPGRVAVWTVGGVLALVLAFLFASTAVTVQVKPGLDPDRVDFAGAIDVGTGGWHLVLPGEYELRVEKAGYVAGVQKVTVTSAANQKFELALAKLPGTLVVDTGGVRATVTANGRAVGEAPGELTLPAGTQLLAFDAPRHERLERTVEIEGLGKKQALQVQLVPGYAAVKFESVPAGAQVLVDGRAVGTTPYTGDLDAGRRAVALAHPEFRTWESMITVKAGEAQTVGPVQLGLPDARLAVRTEPAGADVSVSGAYRGRTPLTLTLAPGAAHEILVTRAGYAPVTRSITLEPKAQQSLALKLEAQLGEIVVQGEPRDAELYVDGRSRGAANQKLSLPSVPHTLEVRKAGLETFRTTLTPRPGLPQSVKYELKTAAEQKVARLGGSVRTSSGQVLKLLPAGRITLGSPRREPGRRTNEAQRIVELKRPVYVAVRAVTNADFRQFKPDHLTGAFRQETLDLDNYPVANVSWEDAAAYCNWLSQRDGLPAAYVRQGGKLVLASPATTGYRLPTEAEWEYAARADGRGGARKYPWGDNLPIPPKAGNWADAQAVYLQGPVLENYDDGFRVAAPVGSFAANALGFYDLGGNVLEWVHDYYTVYPEGGAPAVDPTGPNDGAAYAIRGSSWLTSRVAELRLAYRDYGASGRPNLGFRIARYAE